MALIKCPECGRENVSDSAEMCPGCGYGIKAHFEKIEQEKLKEQQRIEYKKAKIKRDQEAKEREQKRIRNVPKPERPVFSRGLIVYIVVATIFFSWLMLYTPTLYNEEPKGGMWILELLVFIGLPLLIYLPNYNKKNEDYQLACKDFEMYQKKIVKEQDETLKRQQKELEQKIANAIKCPNCGSINTKKITTTSRAISTAMVGMASSKIGKQFECKDCGYKW
ncbi:MAG: zinc ribbon domain-containing protein [Mediterraneibacter sp.]